MEQQHAYQLTENLLLRSTTPLSHQSSHGSRSELLTSKRASSPMKNYIIPPPPLVSPLPDNAVVFKSSGSPQEASDASFHQYIDRQFQQDAPVLKTQLDNNNNMMVQDQEKQQQSDDINEPNTLWEAIRTDLSRVKGTATENRPSDHDDDNNHDDGPRPWWTWDHIDGMYSAGALLFIFGFLFPPLWWLGAFWPRRPERGGKMAKRWQQLNRYLSIGFSIILVIIIIVVAALYGSSHQ